MSERATVGAPEGTTVGARCKNLLCNEAFPQWVSECHRGFCMNCDMNLGPFNDLPEKEICNYCHEEKNMIELQRCKHKLCIECWCRIANEIISITYTVYENEVDYGENDEEIQPEEPISFEPEYHFNLCCPECGLKNSWASET